MNNTELPVNTHKFYQYAFIFAKFLAENKHQIVSADFKAIR